MKKFVALHSVSYSAGGGTFAMCVSSPPPVWAAVAAAFVCYDSLRSHCSGMPAF